jgi:hypothetical protein
MFHTRQPTANRLAIQGKLVEKTVLLGSSLFSVE